MRSTWLFAQAGFPGNGLTFLNGERQVARESRVDIILKLSQLSCPSEVSYVSTTFVFSVICLYVLNFHLIRQLGKGGGTPGTQNSTLKEDCKQCVTGISRVVQCVYNDPNLECCPQFFCRRTITGGYTSSPRSRHKIHLSTIVVNRLRILITLRCLMKVMELRC